MSEKPVSNYAAQAAAAEHMMRKLASADPSCPTCHGSGRGPNPSPTHYIAEMPDACRCVVARVLTAMSKSETVEGPLPRRAVAQPDCPKCGGKGQVVPTSTPGFAASWWRRHADGPSPVVWHCTDYGRTRLGGKYLCGLAHDCGNDGFIGSLPFTVESACSTCAARLEAGETTPVGGLPPVPCECVRYFVLNAVCWGWFCLNTSTCGVFNSDEKEASLFCRTCRTPRPLADLAGRPIAEPLVEKQGLVPLVTEAERMTEETVVVCKYCGCRFGGPARAELLSEHEPECLPTLTLPRTYDGEPTDFEAKYTLFLHPSPSDWPYASKGQIGARMSHLAALIAKMRPEQRIRLYTLVESKRERSEP